MASSEFFTQQSSSMLAGITQPKPTDTLQAIQRQTAYLHQEIQILLDAHSAGLLAGLGQEADSNHDRSNVSPTTGPIHLPISSAESALNESPRSRRGQRRPSLFTSRRKLRSSLLQLAELKKDEAEALEIQRSSLEEFLDNASTLAKKRTQIESSIQSINEQTESGEESLEAEEKSLVKDISTLETQLEELNSRLRHVRKQRREGSSRRTATLSSWQGALDEINHKIKRNVLNGQGLHDVIPDLRANASKSRAVSIWKLPHERRTIELISEDITTRIRSFEIKRDAAEEESTACQDGAEIWKSSIEKLEELEQSLADEMSKLSLTKASDSDQANGETGLVHIVDTMTTTIAHLEGELDLAESKGWNLLLYIIGAEVEALKQGKDLLQETLHVSRGNQTSGTASMMTAQSRMASNLTESESLDSGKTGAANKQNASAGLSSVFDDESVNIQQGSVHSHSQISGNSVDDDGDEDEDAPGPEFLIEHDD